MRNLNGGAQKEFGLLHFSSFDHFLRASGEDVEYILVDTTIQNDAESILGLFRLWLPGSKEEHVPTFCGYFPD